MPLKKILGWTIVVVLILGLTGTVAWTVMGDTGHEAVSGLATFFRHLVGNTEADG